MAASCPVCGFEDRSVSPADAAVALRSLPRRYRGILVRPEDEQEGDNPVTRPGASGWSAVAHAAYAVDAIDRADEALRSVLVHDRPTVVVPAIDPPAPAPAGPPASVLDGLKAVTDALATTIENTGGEQWLRPAEASGGGQVTAVDIARVAVHAGVHHLRLAEAVLREVVGRP
jgi:hypothetical protein